MNNLTPSDLDHLIACPGCDLLLPDITAGEGEVISCRRCRTELHRHRKDSIDRTVALCLAGLLLYFPAMLLPLMTVETLGISETANIIQSAAGYYRQGFNFVAGTVLLAAILFPLLKLSLGFAVAISVKLGKSPRILPTLFRSYIHLEEWAMVEIYLLGIMVTVIKMYHMTTITYGLGFYCFLALVMVMVGTTACLDRKLFWARIERREENLSSNGEEETGPDLGVKAVTARNAGLVACDICHRLTVLSAEAAGHAVSCSFCGAGLHIRKADSIGRTWALILTAAMLFIPANTLPIMHVNYLGQPTNSTILDGIILFFQEGSFGIGLIILAASILVPLFKITGLLIILLTIRFRQGVFLQQTARMFRFIEFIGRWSMLDIFVIAILSVLVQFGLFTSIQAAPAATYFCLVVILTMLATQTFDARLLWDNCFTPSSEKS
ncbi:MAG: PqiA/YebS family transporter subunit [Desulfocapsaceae bacterium]|nr:PqiA/YebS family transporter subunit [Desulfocapsaceae bacterium]